VAEREGGQKMEFPTQSSSITFAKAFSLSGMMLCVAPVLAVGSSSFFYDYLWYFVGAGLALFVLFIITMQVQEGYELDKHSRELIFKRRLGNCKQRRMIAKFEDIVLLCLVKLDQDPLGVPVSRISLWTRDKERIELQANTMERVNRRSNHSVVLQNKYDQLEATAKLVSRQLDLPLKRIDKEQEKDIFKSGLINLH
jgi:hypothetical protein